MILKKQQGRMDLINVRMGAFIYQRLFVLVGFTSSNLSPIEKNKFIVANYFGII
jgi:hypothetical protein